MTRLRDQPGDVRLVLAAFLLVAAGGCAAALVRDRASARPDELLPGPTRVRETYAGPAEPPRSRVERLLEAEGGPFNATGSMRPAFTTRSRDWEAVTRGLGPAELGKLCEEREGERLALLAWVKAGADRAAFDRDDFPIGPELAGQPVTPEMLAGPGRLKVRTLITRRCVDCHAEAGRVERARLAPFDTYERMRPYLEAPGTKRLPAAKLAETSQAHLLGLGLLYAATGVMCCFTGLPRGVRFVLAPLPLVALGVEVGCWWLARWDAAFAWGIVLGGAAAGVGFTAHVLAGLWELAGRRVAAAGRGG